MTLVFSLLNILNVSLVARLTYICVDYLLTVEIMLHILFYLFPVVLEDCFLLDN